MHFPALKDLNLYSVGLRIDGLEDFVGNCAPKLSTLNLSCVSFGFGDYRESEAWRDMLTYHLKCLERVGNAAKALTDSKCWNETF